MSRISASIVVLAATAAFFAAGCQTADSGPGPTFVCSWDNSGNLAADTATGAKEPAKVSNAVQTEGKSGQGLLCRGKDSRIQYALKGFNWKAGTIEFWLNPGWYGFSDSAHRILEINTSAEGTLDFGLDANGGGNLYFSALHAWKDTLYERPNQLASCADWTPGEWHHVAMTWDERECLLYVDGVTVKDVLKDEFKGVLPTAGEAILSLGSDTETG